MVQNGKFYLGQNTGLKIRQLNETRIFRIEWQKRKQERQHPYDIANARNDAFNAVRSAGLYMPDALP